eukprot:CAMPEP_0197430828 /NCGR_PEP_ID=MMETSP1170-20131217/52865_2 /TAXON_ID=54406 /ORGANISM="Sarcinochrysis sp, Strain CCMP770" /LENGTH=90 /DNA_ID=CAMNT_0042958757 /DNA_START=1725 /DNA_END=1997 /DNA_ORIENTATION=-
MSIAPLVVKRAQVACRTRDIHFIRHSLAVESAGSRRVNSVIRLNQTSHNLNVAGDEHVSKAKIKSKFAWSSSKEALRQERLTTLRTREAA